MLTISLIGPLQVSDAEGRDWTPKSAKARGLLAILAVSRDLRRSRTWLRKRLWSASAAAQASDSLRQCLTEIRKAMGPHADILITDRASVSLDPSQITVAYPDPDGASGGDICDELYVPDPVFPSAEA